MDSICWYFDVVGDASIQEMCSKDPNSICWYFDGEGKAMRFDDPHSFCLAWGGGADFAVEGEFVVKDEAGNGETDSEAAGSDADDQTTDGEATNYQVAGAFSYDEFGGSSMDYMSNSGGYEVEGDDYECADDYDNDLAEA